MQHDCNSDECADSGFSEHAMLNTSSIIRRFRTAAVDVDLSSSLRKRIGALGGHAFSTLLAAERVVRAEHSAGVLRLDSMVLRSGLSLPAASTAWE